MLSAVRGLLKKRDLRIEPCVSKRCVDKEVRMKLFHAKLRLGYSEVLVKAGWSFTQISCFPTRMSFSVPDAWTILIVQLEDENEAVSAE